MHNRILILWFASNSVYTYKQSSCPSISLFSRMFFLNVLQAQVIQLLNSHIVKQNVAFSKVIYSNLIKVNANCQLISIAINYRFFTVRTFLLIHLNHLYQQFL